jgi:hypothetical protein
MATLNVLFKICMTETCAENKLAVSTVCIADRNKVHFRRKASTLNPQIFIRLFLVLAAAFLILKSFEYYPTQSGALLFFIFFCCVVRHAVGQVREATWYNKWSMVRRLRHMRKVYLVSPVALALYSVCAAFCCAVPLVHLFRWMTVGLICMSVAGIVLCAATIADWYTRLKYLLESKLATRAIIAIVGFLGTITIFTSNIIANHLAFSVSQAAPAKMPEFVRLVSAVVYPFSLALVVSGFLVVVMGMQSVVMILGAWTTTLVRNLTGAALPLLQKKVENMAYRLIPGRRPPKYRPWWDKVAGTSQFVLRPIGTGALAIFVVMAGVAIERVGSFVPMPYIQEALVTTQYHSKHKCENVDPAAFISFQDDGYVSVAMKSEGKYTFENKKCHS